MWWRRASLLLLPLWLAACGFEPLYAERGPATPGAPGRLAVEVAPIADREGQIMRAALRRTFDQGRAPDYRLDVELAESVAPVAIDRQGDVTRVRMTARARWRLTPLDAPAETEPAVGEARVFEAFSVLASDYANLSAERAARERAAERLAHMIAQAATARAAQ